MFVDDKHPRFVILDRVYEVVVYVFGPFNFGRAVDPCGVNLMYVNQGFRAFGSVNGILSFDAADADANDSTDLNIVILRI